MRAGAALFLRLVLKKPEYINNLVFTRVKNVENPLKKIVKTCSNFLVLSIIVK